MFDKIKSNLDKNSKYYLLFFILLYIAALFLLSLKKYYNFNYNLLDLAIFNQVFFNTLHGNWFVDTVNIDIYLADHFTPIIFLLLPFYSLWQDARFLLLLQSIIIGLSAWPLYLIAKDVLKNKGTALLVASIWLFNPFVHTVNLLEFHLLPVAIFFIFWTFYFYRQHKLNFYILFFVLSLLVREDISFILIAFAIFSFLDKRSWKWKLASLLLPIIYFILAYNIIRYFAPTGDNKFLIYYAWSGGDTVWTIILGWLSHPWSVIGHIFTWKNLLGVVVLLLPFSFLPLLRPKYLFLCLLPFLQILMTAKGFDFSAYSSHYAMFFLPAIFIAMIFSLFKIRNKEKFWLSQKIYKHYDIFKVIFVVAIIYFFIFLSPAWPILFDRPNQRLLDVKRNISSLVNEEASLVAEASFLPSMSKRPQAYPVFYSYFGKNQFANKDFIMPDVDYILVDYSQFLEVLAEKNITGFLQPFKDKMAENWRKKIKDYALIKVQDNIYLWQNKQENPMTDWPLYETRAKTPDDLGDELLLSYSLSDEEARVLKISLQKVDLAGRELLIRFYEGDAYYDMSLDYGLWPMADWPDDSINTFYYYPGQTVDAFEIFSWYGGNKLGHLKELIVDKKVFSETEKIIF